MLRRFETLRVMESSSCFSDCRRLSFFSVSSRLEPRLVREREDGGGGERSMRGRTLTFVLVPVAVSFCGKFTKREQKERKKSKASQVT